MDTGSERGGRGLVSGLKWHPIGEHFGSAEGVAPDELVQQGAIERSGARCYYASRAEIPWGHSTLYIAT